MSKIIQPDIVCKNVFGLTYPPGNAELKKRFRQMAKSGPLRHPDTGGTHEGFVSLQQSYAIVQKAIDSGWKPSVVRDASKTKFSANVTKTRNEYYQKYAPPSKPDPHRFDPKIDLRTYLPTMFCRVCSLHRFNVIHPPKTDPIIRETSTAGRSEVKQEQPKQQSKQPHVPAKHHFAPRALAPKLCQECAKPPDDQIHLKSGQPSRPADRIIKACMIAGGVLAFVGVGFSVLILFKVPSSYYIFW